LGGGVFSKLAVLVKPPLKTSSPTPICVHLRLKNQKFPCNTCKTPLHNRSIISGFVKVFLYIRNLILDIETHNHISERRDVQTAVSNIMALRLDAANALIKDPKYSSNPAIKDRLEKIVQQTA
jgi:hypothetical protein